MDGEAWHAAETTYGLTEDSVHELITCGGLQMSVSRSLVLLVLLSNAERVEARALEDISEAASWFGLITEVPMEDRGEGDWVVPMGEGSDFSLRFYDGDATDPILSDPFRLESYLEGAVTRSEMTWGEMMDDYERPNTFTITWERLGPLGHILYPEGEPETRELVLRMSLVELALAGLGQLDDSIGPFARLRTIEVESDLVFVDQRGEVSVEYTAKTRRASSEQVVFGAQLEVELQRIEADARGVELAAETGELIIMEGSLAGRIDYAVRVDGEPVAEVVSDFGEGAAYPRTEWACR